MIYLGSDHAGFELKQEVKKYLEASGREVKDLGNTKLVPDDDYPDFSFAVGEAIRGDFGSYGILVCGSSHGACMAVNKVRGVRASSCMTAEDAKKTREDNNANVLCLSGWNMKIDDAKPIVDTFLDTPFSDAERHHRRVGKITDYEEKHLQ